MNGIATPPVLDWDESFYFPAAKENPSGYARKVSKMIVDPDRRGLNSYRVMACLDLLACVILFVLLDARIRHRTLQGVAALLLDGGELRDEVRAKIVGTRASDDPASGVRAVMQVICDTASGKLERKRKKKRHAAWQDVARMSQALLEKSPDGFSAVVDTAFSLLGRYREHGRAYTEKYARRQLPDGTLRLLEFLILNQGVRK